MELQSISSPFRQSKNSEERNREYSDIFQYGFNDGKTKKKRQQPLPDIPKTALGPFHPFAPFASTHESFYPLIFILIKRNSLFLVLFHTNTRKMLQEVTNHAIPSVFPHLHLQLESGLRSALRTLLLLLAFVPHPPMVHSLPPLRVIASS